MTETPTRETESAEKFREHAISEAAEAILTEIILHLKPSVRKQFDETLKSAIDDLKGSKSEGMVRLSFGLDVLDAWEQFEEAGALI